MSGAVVLGRGVRGGAAPAGLPVVSPGEAPSGRHDRLLVIGSLAEVAALAAACPGRAIAFAGRHELTALFALDPGPTAARHRLEHGTVHPADLGWLHLGGTTVPFLGHVVAGAGTGLRCGFPWAGRPGPVGVIAGRAFEVAAARTVIVSNVQRLGGFTVAPRAAIDDGRVDISVLAGSAIDLLRLRPALRHGLHERSPLVRRATASECQGVVPDRWRVSADGVTVGRGSFGVTLHPGAVTLLV
ncbi:MAG: hypothetical protein HZA58_00245 [Acidimicrobiia bacterium]|nr:hypothetical protein [Acidimicrobiia bacterium]